MTVRLSKGKFGKFLSSKFEAVANEKLMSDNFSSLFTGWHASIVAIIAVKLSRACWSKKRV